MLPLLLSIPQRIIAVSNFTRDLAAHFVGRGKIEVIPNGIDPQKLRTTLSNRSMKRKLGLTGKKVLLSVGNLVGRKGHDTIIRALPNVQGSVRNVAYVIVGTGPEKDSLRTLAEELGVENSILFTGFIKNKELANYYNMCDVFVLMSRTIAEKSAIEGFGIAYIEAAFLGKPVIGGKSGGTDDSIDDGVTGFLVEPEDVDALSKKIIFLLKNPAKASAMGKSGKQRVLSRFLWRHNVRQTVVIYKKAIAHLRKKMH